MDKEKIIEAMAKGICVQELIECNDYPDRMPEDPTSDWFRADKNNPQQIWELRRDYAEAALKALCKELPEFELYDDTDVRSSIDWEAEQYQQLLEWGKNDNS